MKDHALRIILFMYILSGSLAAMEITVAQPLGMSIEWNGQPIGPRADDIIEAYDLAETVRVMREEAGAAPPEHPLAAAYRQLEVGIALAGDLFRMIMGLYAFDILLMFGLDQAWVDLIVSVYVILVARAALGYMPAIAAAVGALAQTAKAVRG